MKLHKAVYCCASLAPNLFLGRLHQVRLEEGIATWFLEQDVPQSKIVLGFQPPTLRPYTEFAVA